MKRFEYRWIFQSKPDLFLEKHLEGYKSKISELPVSIYLNSFSEFKKQSLPDLLSYYDFLRTDRTGKKIRSFDLVLKIKWHAFVKSLS